MSKLGEIVKQIRKSQNMNQEEFAKSLGYKSKSTINKIELGINDMTYAALKKLVSKYYVDVNELFGITRRTQNDFKTEEIAIFENQGIKLEVNVKNETVWLNQDQIAKLYGRDRTVILRHIKNALNEELASEKSVCANFAQTATDGKTYDVKFYNLDVIVSVGYRIKSKQGIAFRKWANEVLKSYIIKGYAVNKKRLSYLEKTVKLIDIATRNEEDLTTYNANDVLLVINNFSKALDLLDDYDHQTVPKIKGNNDSRVITYDDCLKIIQKLKFNTQSDLFAKEQNNGFKAIIGNIYQTFNGEDVYPTIELKAVNLLYFIVKDHAFVDGNKRIAATIFLYFMHFYGLLYKNNKPCISNNTLVALTLLIAESKPQEKDLIIDVSMNIIFG